MHDFHTHSILSDGDLVPSELIRRAREKGYETLAITDHVDFSNIEFVMESLKKVETNELELVRGVELTHVPPGKIEKLARKARELGAEIIVVHGETIVEPVVRGTNRNAVRCEEVDLLAHPGMISEDDAEAARENGIFLEITSRHGHCLCNGHVARVCMEVGADLLFSTDAHSPEDLVSFDGALRIMQGAGLSTRDASRVLRKNPEKLLGKLHKQ